MTYEQLIDYINNFDYIKNNNVEVEKIQFQEVKSTGHRYIWVRFKKQKYKAGLYLWPHDIRYTQVQPAFNVGIGEDDKDGWTIDIRRKLLHWLFCRFWIWIKHVDRIYDQYVNGNWGKNSLCTEDDKWSIDIFTGLVHDGWSISKHTIEDILDLNIPLKEMYNLYNEDVSDNLYKNYGHIEYGNMTYKELTTDEEFKNVRIGF